jgi:ATP-dependent Zn protease
MFVARHKLMRNVMRQQAELADRQRTALHEAGHAIVKAALGGVVHLVTLNKTICTNWDPDEPADGICVGEPTKGRRQMAVQVAGRVAEEAYGYSRSWYGPRCEQDAEGLRALARHNGLSEQQALSIGEARARKVIRRYRSAIAAVAKALMGEGLLTGRDIRTLMAVARLAA